MDESKIYFVFGSDSKSVVEIAKKHTLSELLSFVTLEEFLKDPKRYTKNEKILLCASTDEIKSVMKVAMSDCSFAISIVAREDQNYLRDSFHLSQDLSTNITQALEAKVKEMDLLFCGNQIALNLVQIGNTPPLSYLSDSFEKKSLKERIRSFIDIFKKFKNLHQSKITLKSAKEQEITTVASGVVVVEHDNKTFASKLISDKLRVNDSKLSALIISPPSIMGYLGFLFKTMVLKPKKDTLPDHIGYIETQSLYIDSSTPLEVKVDAKEFATTPIKLEVKERAIKMALPDSFWQMEGSRSDKESIRLSTLPTSNDLIDYQSKKLPLFTHASEEQYQNLFVSLREEAKASSTFMTLIFLSTLLATVGLYLNSSSVIIGAMLLAPLMQPIVSFSMGVLRADKNLYEISFKTILIGVAIALFSSALFALVMPYDLLTNEMQGRLKPSILDLFVALISGAAAAYAKNNEKISGSLVGVSIAVALVPPIAVSGIGLGWLNLSMFYHSFLLFLTNFAGIVFAAAMLFLIQGFSPIKRAKRGLAFSLAVALLVSIPLYLSFKTIKEDADIKSRLVGKEYILDGMRVEIRDVVASHDEGLNLSCEIVTPHILNESQKIELKRDIEEEIKKSIKLEAIERILF